VDQELGVPDQIGMVFDEPTGAHARADLLVRRGEKNDVALERRARALEDDQRHQLRDLLTLHVERATSPHVPVLHHAAERVHLPVLRAGEHDVHVIEKISGRRVPSPCTRANRFALPGAGSNTCASIPSRPSTDRSQCAAFSSFPGGFVVLMAMYCDNSVAASCPAARHSASFLGTPSRNSWGGSSTGCADGPTSDGRSGRTQPTKQSEHSPTRTR